MIGRLNHVAIAVANLAQGSAVYRDVLGGTVDYSFPEDDPQFATVSLGGTTVAVGSGTPAPTDGFSLCVYVDDVDSAVDVMIAAGAGVVEQPSDQPWGERMARVTDPDGYRLVVVAKI